MAGEVIGEPTECDLFRTRGDTRDFVVLVDSDDAGTPQDITGWSGIMTITSDKAPVDASTVVFQATGAPDPQSPQVAINRMIFDFSTFAAQSPQLVPIKGFYDVQLTDDAGKISTVLQGKYEIGQDRTK
jgi:hypothetical protein